jgi:lipid II:glycine glycyltransferase (peptidoglycan interpeptide bridge formation enzyme)
MIFYKKRSLRFAELWFDEPGPDGTVDVLIYNQASVPPDGVAAEEKTTIVIDLTQPTDALLTAVQKDTRADVRRAQRDGVLCCEIDTHDQAARHDFYEYYDSFAQQKGLNALDRPRMETLAADERLSITAAVDAAGQKIVYHAYVVCGTRARLLYSASQLYTASAPRMKSFIGRANRMLHWEDILLFKAKRFAAYDLGGWYAGEFDADRLRINRFKEEFGGKKLKEYSATAGVSLAGRFAVFIWRCLKVSRS